MGEDVYIIGVGMIKFGKWLDKSIKDITGEALDLVLKDCELTRDDVEAAWFSNTMWGMYSFQHSIRGQVALSANGLEGIPVTNVENACASASTALNGAWMAIKAGLYDCLLAIGAEKLYDQDRAKVMRSFMAGTDVEEMTRTVAQLRELEKKRREKAAKDKGTEIQQEKSGGHSAFMDFYAAGARAHMEKYSSTQRQLAVIAAKAHNNSTLNPLAQYTFPQTVEQVMQDRVVSYPLTRAMCAPIGDGAAAAIVCSEQFLKKHPTSRAVKIKVSVLEGGTRVRPDDVSERASKKAYEIASVGPEDIDVMEVHDATAFGEVSQLESLGFCPPGEGGILAESGATALDGEIPVNPSGGLISRGHPIGASGLAQIYELVTQLRGEAGERQVKNHRLAMAENGGGTIGKGEAAMMIHILEKV
ncbi:MAG: thiolase family protein [Deltaproteobacteria bacterium]|nr:thiolase family protein [Deltaproteobacteria bacterium]